MSNITEEEFNKQMEIRDKTSDLINLLGELNDTKTLIESIEYIVTQLNTLAK